MAKKVETKKTKIINKNSIAHRVLLRPVVSEKATALETKNKYVFIVNRSTNKTEIKKAIKSLYHVNPISVSVLNVEGKRKRFGPNSGKRNDYKKAIISLPKGKTIHIHEGV